MKDNQKVKKSWQRLSRKPDFSFIKAIRTEYPNAEVYLVGGAVRDMLLGIAGITDFDFVVRNITQNKLSRFLKQYGKVNFVGKTFGVFKLTPTVHTLPHEIDVALPRTEVAIQHSGAYKDFSIESNPSLGIAADLSRRDFTVNALAYNVFTGELLDPFGGIADLKEKKIDTVGIPKRRFSEDYSRMLRALRFSCQLNFTITPRTWSRIQELAPKIQKKIKKEWVVPREVLAKELLQSFTYNPVIAFDLYDRSGMFALLMPEVLKMKKCPQPKQFHTEGDVWTHTRLALAKLSSPAYKKFFPKAFPNTLVTIATLLHDVGKPPKLQTPKEHKVDRIRFNGHDTKGATIAHAIATRLRFSSAGMFAVSPDGLSWIIKNHLLLVHGPVEQLRNATLEKYFFTEGVPGNELLQLFFADGSATVPPAGKVNLQHLKTLFQRLKKLRKIIDKRPHKTLLNGNDIMKHLTVPAGPQIGELLLSVREAELEGKVKTKKQALSYIKKIKS